MSYQLFEYQVHQVSKAVSLLNMRDSVTIAAPVSSGKGVMAAQVVLNRNDKIILMMAPSWIQLVELEKGVDMVHGKRCKKFRVGGSNDLLKYLDEYEGINSIDTNKVIVIFSTIQTISSKSRARSISLMLNHVDIMFLDESHMVARGKMLKKLKDLTLKKNIKLVELTGTPVEGCSEIVKGAPTLQELEKLKRIAPCELIPVKTNQKFSVEIQNNSISESSFTNLSENKKRNCAIAEFIKKTQFNKSFVVCCNIKHCYILLTLILKKMPNAQIGIYHGNLKKAEKAEILKDFRSGKIRMLLGVRALFTGLSVEDAETLFNTRPTRSPREFLQVYGRIIRSHPNKLKAFYYDFTDNIDVHGDRIYKPTEATESKNDPDKIKKLIKYPRELFEIDKTVGFSNYLLFEEDINYSLPINNGIPFGVEIGFNKINDTKVESVLLTERMKLLSDLSFRHYFSNDLDSNIDYEAAHSLLSSDSCGAEIATKVLRGPDGIKELLLVVNSLKSLQKLNNLNSNSEAGLHVHIGGPIREGSELRIFLHNLRAIEPYLALLISPSRICEQTEGVLYNLDKESRTNKSWLNTFSYEEVDKITTFESLKVLFEKKQIDPKHLSFNLTSLLYDKGLKTIEIRLCESTFDSVKVISWVSLMSQLIETLKIEHSFTHSSKKSLIPIPNSDTKNKFREVLSEALNKQSESLINLLDIRAEKGFQIWNNLKKI